MMGSCLRLIVTTTAKIAIERLAVNGWTHCLASLRLPVADLVRALGYAGSKIQPLPMAKDLRPRDTGGARPGSMSSKIGLSEQPFHTDGAFRITPPRHLIFECLDPGEVLCSTEIWALNWVRLIHDRPTILREPPWLVRQSRSAAFYTQVLACTGTTGGLIRFDPCCMVPVQEAVEVGRETMAAIECYSRLVQIDWAIGDVLVIDNWRCLHRRADATRSPSRCLRRWELGGSLGLVG